VIAGVILAVHSAQSLRGMIHSARVARTVATYHAIENSGRTLTAAQKTELEQAEKMRSEFVPDPQTVEKEIRATRSGFLANLRFRAPTTASWESDFFYRFLFWDVAGMLILGMGLMKLGVFDASRSFRFYAWMATIGYGIGLPLDLALSTLWERSHFDMVRMYAYMNAPSDIVRFSIAAGHVAVVMMICKAGKLPRARKALSNVGRMALSNYLLTSLLCALFFYGYGLGMFARLERYQLLYVLASVWTINLIFSTIWLKYFRFGPMEWLWRSLTYWKLQPMRIVDAARRGVVAPVVYNAPAAG
jgi:uncharacterized protein